MQNLWKWLMQANAKHAFIIACCILLAAAAASVWQFASAATEPNALPTVENTRATPVATIPTSTGLLDFVNRQLDYSSQIPFNPFAPSLAIDNIQDIVRIRTIRQQEREQGTTRTRQWGTANTGTPNVTTVNQVPQPNAPAAPPPPVLTYRGFITRPDGTPAVLIHNSATRSATFLTTGKTVAGATLLNITHDSIRLRLPNGEEHDLPLRESITLK